MCNSAKHGLKKRLDFASLWLLESGSIQPAHLHRAIGSKQASACRRLAGLSAQQARVPGPASALPQPTRGLQQRASRYTRQDTGVRTLVTEASHSTSMHSSGLL